MLGLWYLVPVLDAYCRVFFFFNYYYHYSIVPQERRLHVDGIYDIYTEASIVMLLNTCSLLLLYFAVHMQLYVCLI